MRVPTYLEVAKQLEDTGEAEYIDHRITPVPFDVGYEVNGPDLDGERYGDLEAALAAIRATVAEPEAECANCGDPYTVGPLATPDTAPYCSSHCYHQGKGERCPGPCGFCDDNEAP